MTRRQIRYWLAGLSLPVVLAAAPLAASAQTPEPAAGNPAIDTTPPSSANGGSSAMASPSNASNIPKGSNPESGSGNLAAGSGATPSSQSADNPTQSQTADNPNAAADQTAPSGADGTRGGDESVPQGKYASPPDLLPQSRQ